jgi:hypothetical protein
MTMALQREIELLADQYGGIGAANRENEGAAQTILEPIVGNASKTRLRALRDGFWARSQAPNDRYADLAGVLEAMLRTK